MIQHHNYENMSLQQILDTFSHYQQVNFAFYCAKDVESLANDQRVIDCNNIIQQWLNGDKTVDLELARNNAWNAWHDSAVDAAYYAASSASSASSAYTAYTAYTAYYAAYYAAAFYAANAKSYNLYPNNNEQRTVAYNQFFQEYKQIAQNWLSYWIIPNFPKEESDFPIFDFLQDYNLVSYLLPKSNNVYYLNLNGFDLKHVNEADLLKEANTMHIKNILRRIINNAETS